MKILMIGFLLTLSACSQISSNEVEASSIFGELSLKRSEGSATAIAQANFFVGGATGTIVRMESPAKVEINGHKASEVTDPMINMVSYQSSVSTDATVLYTDKDGGTYSNVLRMPGSMTASLPSGTAFISQGFSVNYSSSSLFVGGESLEITLSNPQRYQKLTRSLITSASSGTAVIQASELRDFPPGNLSVTLCRTSHPKSNAPFPKGAFLQVESCSNEKVLNLQI